MLIIHSTSHIFLTKQKTISDLIYYLHEPLEEEHLFMTVYPYEVPLLYIDVLNDDGIGGADIPYKKEKTRMIPGKGGCCKEIPISTFMSCIRFNIASSLKNSTNITCKVPALDFTDLDSTHLKYCSNKDEALKVNGLIYEYAQRIQTNELCGNLCNRTEYSSTLNFLAKNVLSKELKKYGQGWYIIWAFYSSLYVEEAIETYLYEFDGIIVAIGGSIGLFLGWSLYSVILYFIEILLNWCRMGQKKSGIASPGSNVI